MVKKILLGLALVFVALQFHRPEKNVQAATPKTDFLVLHPAPPEVKRMLEVGCYDCHSNQTRYPFYAEIMPLGWWLDQHVRDGKAELNLSTFGALPAKTQGTRVEEMIDVIADRSMPLKSYTLTHRDAIFTDEQIKLITDYLDAVREKIGPE